MSTLQERPLRSRFRACDPGREPGSPLDAARLATVALADCSFLGKTGLKGPRAAEWLERRGIPVPQRYNAWAVLPGGGLVARLAVSEFFLEDGPGGAVAAGVERELGSGAPGVWPVLRQDAGIALAGALARELLAQTCSFHFAGLDAEDRTAVMTSMAGVTVLAVRRSDLETPCYRIWCDPTYAPYLWDVLAEIAAELGGGTAGARAQPAPGAL